MGNLIARVHLPATFVKLAAHGDVELIQWSRRRPCNSRATEGLETGRFGQERSGFGYRETLIASDFLVMGRFADRRTTFRIPLGLAARLVRRSVCRSS